MGYFDTFPTIEYDVDKTGNTVELTNILRNVRIKSDIKTNQAVFLRYAYKDTDRPEFIADKVYDDSELHWIIMKMNDVVDPHYDLPISEFALEPYVATKYPGQTFFLNADYGATSSSSSSGSDGFVNIVGSFTTGEYVYTTNVVNSGTAAGGTLSSIKLDSAASSVDDYYNGAVIEITAGTGAGQFAIIADYDASTRYATFLTPNTEHLSCDSTYAIYTSGEVHQWDSTYSKLVVKDIVGTFAQYDTIIGQTSGTTASIQRKVAESKSAVHHFEDASTGKWYNPYDSTIPYLAGYIMNTSNSIVDGAVITNQKYEQDINDSKRFVSILDPDLIPTVISDFERLMREE